mgnify:CR=1 FL=1
MDPRTGWRVGGGVDWGTPYLGGSNDFYKYYGDVSKYTPLVADTRIANRVRYGKIETIGNSKVPLSELFWVGGINTVRGFVFGKVGRQRLAQSVLAGYY